MFDITMFAHNELMNYIRTMFAYADHTDHADYVCVCADAHLFSGVGILPSITVARDATYLLRKLHVICTCGSAHAAMQPGQQNLMCVWWKVSR